MLTRLIRLISNWLTPERTPRHRRRPAGSMAEPLESRIAPATLINSHMVSYANSDGNLTTVFSSLPIFTKTNVNTLLTFDTGTVDGASTIHQVLKTIELSSLDPGKTAGDNISVTVKQVGGSHSLSNVGNIHADFALGKVTIQGELDRIQAGAIGPEGGSYVGLAGLTVNTFGNSSMLASQAGVVSVIEGRIGSFTVQSDMIGASLEASSNTAGNTINGSIGAIKIGGKLQGGADALSGSIKSDGAITSLTITGGLVGGAGTSSGSISAGTKIGKVTTGSLIGYTIAGDTSALGASSASITTGNNFPNTGGIGSITINGDMIGGDGSKSGRISEESLSGGSIGPVKITGKLQGGSGDDSGQIDAFNLGAISIGQGIIGSSGQNSGYITSANGIASLTILHGGIVGGTNTNAGSINAATAPTGSANIGSIVIHGDITGVTGDATTLGSIAGTGQIQTESGIGSFTLYGSLVGNVESASGSLLATGNIGKIKIHSEGSSTGSLLGGVGANSGEISAASIGAASIDGSITGGGDVVPGGPNTGAGSGKMTISGGIGSLTIGHGILGGNGAGSGVVDTGDAFGHNLGTLNILSGGIHGGVGDHSGAVTIGGKIGTVKLNGSAITGDSGIGSGVLTATDNIGSITAGSMIVGTGANSGGISTGGNLTSLSLTGLNISSPTDAGFLSVQGSLGTITVNGDVAGSVASSGLIQVGAGIGKISISGKLGGGITDSTDTFTGSIFAGLDGVGVIGSVTIADGIVGGAGASSGQLFAGGGIKSAAIGGLSGGGGVSSGSILTNGALGSIIVSGATGIQGGTGISSGVISAGTTIKSISVHGNLQAGTGQDSGAIVSHSQFGPSGDVQGDIGSITIQGDIRGDIPGNTAGTNSGLIAAAGNITTLSISGNVFGGLADNTGAVVTGLNLTGATGGDIKSLTIGGVLEGANVSSGTVNGSGYISAGHIGTATIGSIQSGVLSGAGAATLDGAILAANDIASLTFKGAITGNYSNSVIISAVGQVTPGKTDLAIGKISVGTDGTVLNNSVTYTDFLAGYDQTGTPVNRGASIGTVAIAGNWSASNLVAGVVAGAGADVVTGATSSSHHFGSQSNAFISDGTGLIPSIASIIIKGHIDAATVTIGQSDSADMYGITAGKIGALSIHGVSQSLANGSIVNLDNSTDTSAIIIPSV